MEFGLISFTKQLFRSKEGKTLVSNFAYLSLLQIASYIFPILTIPYLARVIGVNMFGKIAFANAVILYFSTIVDWGYNYIGPRDIAINRDNNKKISEIISQVLWARLFLLIFCYVAIIILCLSFNKLNDNFFIIIITSLSLIGRILFPEWVFQGLERMKYISYLNVFAKLFFTLLVFVVIKKESDYYWQPLLISIGSILCGIIALYIIIHSWGYKIYKPSFSMIWKSLKGGFDMFLNDIIPTFYNNLSILLIGIFYNNKANGIFNAGNKFYTIVFQLFSIIYRVVFPYLSRKNDKIKTYRNFILIFSLFTSILLFICSPIIIHIFFTPEFYKGIIVLKILSFSIFFQTLSNIYGTNILVIKHREKDLRNVYLVVSSIGLVLSLILVYYFSFIGAAIVITFSRALLGLGCYLKVKQLKKIGEI